MNPDTGHLLRMDSELAKKLFGEPETTEQRWVPRIGLDWVICGSETGPNRRPTKAEWIRDLRDQCITAGVPFFLKQMEIDGKVVKMPKLDGQTWNEFPRQEVAGWSIADGTYSLP